MDDTLEGLKQYLQNTYKIPTSSISRETSLLNDLQWTGDDVDEFFARLIKDFSIDVKRLNFSRFVVGDEPLDFIGPIIRYFNKKGHKRKTTILIGDVERFIETGILE